MRKLMRISALLLIVMLAVFAVRMPNAMAQGTPEGDMGSGESTGAFDDLSQLEGLQEAVGRSYSLDYESLMSNASPEAMADMEFPEGVQLLSAAVFKFDNDDNAKAAQSKAGDEIKGQAMEELQLEDVEIEGLNDDTIALGATTEDETLGTTSTTVALTQEDEYLYLAVGVATGAETDTTQIVGDIVSKMIDTDASDDEVSFNEDGTSTGGLWSKLPAADDELVTGLVASDEQIFPEPEGGE